MDEETTPVASEDTGGQSVNGIPIDDQGMAIPQPEETEQPTAEPEPTEEQANDNEEETTPEPSETDDTSDEWLKKKGIDPNDPEAIQKLAKTAREAEKAMHQATTRRSELEKAAKITEEQLPTDASPETRDNVRIRNIELRYDVQQWKMENQDKLDKEPQMIQILSDPNKKLLVQEGYLTLDDVYSMARGMDSSNEATLKSQGKREALQTLAQKQQAATPRGNATNSAAMSGNRITPQNVDQMVAGMSSQEYRRRLPEINRAMSG